MGSSCSKRPSRRDVTGSPSRKRNTKCGKQSCVVCSPSDPDREDHLRLLGNACFRAGRYEDALEMYTSSIQSCYYNPTAYTNRANTLMRLNRLEEAVNDCLEAVKLAPESVKPHYYLGQCLCELKSYEKGLWHLEEALRLCKTQGVKFERDIKAKLKYWRRYQLSTVEESQKLRDKNLQSKLRELINEERDKKIQVLKEKLAGGKWTLGGHVSKKEVQESIIMAEKQSEKLLEWTNKAFDKLQNFREHKRLIPEHLCCKISLCLMQEPVITPYGITYDRQSIVEHLRRGNGFDPTTRQPLTEEELVTNYALKEAIEDFLAENEWALSDDLNSP